MDIDFKEYYVNSSEEGFKWLYDFSEVEKPPLCSHGSDNEILVNCPWCGKNINAQIEENGTVTLNQTSFSASCEDYGNGWFRCSIYKNSKR